MKRVVLLLSIIFGCITARSQQLQLHVTLSGSEKGVPYTAKLVSLPDSGVIVTRLINASDSFAVIANSQYLLTVTAASKKTSSTTLSIADSSLYVNINLKENTAVLGNVTVTARRPLVRQEDDKTIVDAEPLAESSTNAYEILEKTPGAVVDQDGNVYLTSATPATIQINGREMKLSAADLASLLKSLPANSVVKIEILRNPSAKYDAASSGGILNIVLKKGVRLGVSGSANAGYFQGRYGTFTSGFNLNNGSKNVTTYLSYQFTNRNNFEELSSNRIIPLDNSNVSQVSFTKYPANNNYLGGGIDLSLNNKWSIGYDARISLNNNNSRAVNDINILDMNTGTLKGYTGSIINNDNSSVYIGNNISSKYKIDSLGSEWTVSLDFNPFKSDNEQDYLNSFSDPSISSIFGNGEIDSRKNIVVLQTDAVFKLRNKFTFETGGKLTYSKSNNNALYFIDKGSGPVTDSFQTNRFRYRETITSAYVQIARTFGKLTVKPGVRMETTEIAGNQIFPRDTSLAINRTDYFPYLYLRHPLFKLFGFQLTGNAIVRRSINRPYYEILNPYPKYIDQFLYDIGNPSLKPQFTTNYEFNVTADDYPVASIGVNDTRDIFTNVTYQDDATRIAYRTYDNLGRNREFYLRLVGGIPPGGKYFFYAGTQHNVNHFEGFYQGKPLNYKRGSWIFFMYHNFKASKTLTISSSSFMRLRGLQNFYELNTFGSANLSFNKTVLNRKGNIILAFNDLFLTNQYEFSLQQGSLNATGKRFNDTRRVGLTFRYNFGIKPREEKKPMFEQPAEN